MGSIVILWEVCILGEVFIIKVFLVTVRNRFNLMEEEIILFGKGRLVVLRVGGISGFYFSF